MAQRGWVERPRQPSNQKLSLSTLPHLWYCSLVVRFIEQGRQPWPQPSPGDLVTSGVLI